MKTTKFDHLHAQKRALQDDLPSANVKKTVLVLMILFFFFYINVKPYSGESHPVTGISGYLFTLYRFVINQTLGIVHEGGHGVCYLLPCPQFLTAAMGTIFQWAFPLLIALYYRYKGNMTAFYIGMFILGMSMDYTAWYMSTAHEGLYVPASKSFLGVDGLHDFNYIFSALGVLSYESLISGVVKAISILTMTGSVIGMFFEAFSNRRRYI